MNHYQDQTKKKPLIQYHQKSKYNQPTISIKDKIKKDKSAQKQNAYENHNNTNKRFKDFNVNMNIQNSNGNKYHAQYNTNNANNENDHGHQGYKKSFLLQQNNNNNNINILSNGIITSPNNIENTSNIMINNTQKNLTFGFVKNAQHQTQTLTKQQQLNNILIENQNSQNNHIISVNVNIQNLQPNNNFINTQNQDIFKKINNNKYQTNAIKYEINNNINKHETHKYDNKALTKKAQPILRINNNKNENINNNTKNNVTTNVLTQRYIQKTNIIQRNDRLQRKQKLKKQFHEKFNFASSPIDKEFICQQQLDLKTIDFKNIDKKQGLIHQKATLLFQKKTSEKGLNLNNNQLQLSQNNRFNKKNDKKALQLKQLKQFESEQKQVNLIECSESIKILFQQQQKYFINPCYLEKNQKAINWLVRAILIDWMRQLSQQYSLKRDTYHLAVVLLDNFLQKKGNIQKQVTQVIGATTLFIASKLEQIQCRPSQSFAESTRGLCTDKDIKNWEIQICKTLQFRLNPPTISSLANRIMTQWDKYIDQVEYAIHHLSFQGKQKIYFKKMGQLSYKLFRQLMQFIDCQILDIQTSQYKPVLIVLSIMYLILGTKIGGFNNQDIYQNFPRGSYYLLDKTNYFNDLFENFINSTFGLTLLQILPSVQYTATYFNLQLNFQKPLLGQNQQDLQQMDYQQYCSFQTYNRHMLKTVQNRFRGILDAF